MDYYKLTTSQKEVIFGLPNTKKTDLLNLMGVSLFFKDCNLDALEKAYNNVVCANDSLRLKISGKIFLKQSIREFDYLAIDRIYSCGYDGFVSIAQNLKCIPIRRNSSCLHRATLVDAGNGEGGIIIFIHHLATDAYGLCLISKEIEEAYAAEVLSKEYSFNTGSYLDYVKSNEAYLKSNKVYRDKKWWKNYYFSHNNYKIITAPAKKGTCGNVIINFDNNLIKKALDFCQVERCSIASVIKTAIAITIFQITGENQFSISDLIHERSNTSLHKTVGCIMRTVQLLFDINPENSFCELVHATSRNSFGVIKHSNMPIIYNFIYPIKAMISSRTVYNYWFYFSQFDEIKNFSCMDVKIDLYGEEELNAPFYCCFVNKRNPLDSYILLKYQSEKFSKETINEYVNLFQNVLKQGLEEYWNTKVKA